MAIEIDPRLIEQTRVEYLRLRDLGKPREASAYLRQVAERNYINLKTFHSRLNLRVRSARTVSVDVQVRHAEIDRYARMLWEFVRDHSFDDHKLSVVVAYEHLIAEERIPSDVSIKAIYESIARMNLKNIAKPVTGRFERKTAMTMWQVDFSKSAYFRHVHNAPGTIEVRDPEFTKRQADGKALMLGIAIDDASRVMYVNYFVASGESEDEVIEFFLGAFDQKPGFLLQGQPKSFYVDNGSGWVGSRTKGGLQKLGVQQILGGFRKDSEGRALRDRNKSGRGKVEKSVNTIKQRMEASLWLKFGDRRKMMLSDLNDVVTAWVEEWNQGEHPTRRGEGKWNVFGEVAGLEFASLVYPTDDARAYFSRAITKKVVARKINVGTNLFALAPAFVSDGEHVEIVRDQTGYYLFIDGKRHRLTIQGIERTDETNITQVELKTTMLSDRQLKKRYEQEMLAVLGQSFRDVGPEFWEDNKPFFEQPRTIAEIEEHVAWMKVGQNNVPSRAKIIQLTPDTYVR